MKKLINNRDIIYFTRGPFRDYGSNLKLFLSFLKIAGEKGPLKFSYTGTDTGLLQHITIEENITLSITNNMKDIKNAGYLGHYIHRLGNPFLKKLYLDLKMSCHMDMLPHQVTPYTAKKALLVKALIQPCRFMIFEHRGTHFTDETYDLMQKAIQFAVNSAEKVALITDQHLEKWRPYATKVISLMKEDKLSFSIDHQETHTGHLSLISSPNEQTPRPPQKQSDTTSPLKKIPA